MSCADIPPTVTASPVFDLKAFAAPQPQPKGPTGPTLYDSYPSGHPEDQEAPEAGEKSVVRAVVVEPLWCLHVSNVLFMATFGVLAPVLPIYAREFGVDAVAGISLALQGAGKVALAFPNAAAAHALGFRCTVVAACAAYAAVTLFSAAGATLTALLVASVGWGAATGLYFLGRQTFCGHLVPKERRGRLLSLVGGTTRWGSVVGPIIGGALAEHCSVSVALAAQVPLVFLAAVLFGASDLVRGVERASAPSTPPTPEPQGPPVVYDDQFMCRGPGDGPGDSPAEIPPPPPPAAPSGDLTFLDTMRCVRRHWRPILRTGSFTHTIFALRIARRFLLPLAALNQNLSGTWVGAVVAGSFLIDACFFFISGFMMDTFGRKIAAAPASILLGAAFLILAWADSAAPTAAADFSSNSTEVLTSHAGSQEASSHGTALLALAAAAFGIADSFGSGIMLTLHVDAVPPDGGPAFLTALNMLMDLGQVVGALVPSLVAQWWGVSTACAIMAVWGIVNGLASVVVLPGKLGVH